MDRTCSKNEPGHFYFSTFHLSLGFLICNEMAYPNFLGNIPLKLEVGISGKFAIFIQKFSLVQSLVLAISNQIAKLLNLTFHKEIS